MARSRKGGDVLEGIIGLIALAVLALVFAAYTIVLFLPLFFFIGFIYYGFLRSNPFDSKKEELSDLCAVLDGAHNNYVEVQRKYAGLRTKKDGSFDERSNKGKMGNIEKADADYSVSVAEKDLEKVIKPYNSSVFYRWACIITGVMLIVVQVVFSTPETSEIDGSQFVLYSVIAIALSFLIAKLASKSQRVSPYDVAIRLDETKNRPSKIVNLLVLSLGVLAVVSSFKLMGLSYDKFDEFNQASGYSEVIKPFSDVLGVTTTNVNLRSAPSVESNVIYSVERNSRLMLNGKTESGKWYRVTSDDGSGNLGYISSKYVEMIKN